MCVCPVAGPPAVPASSSCLHQQSEEERGAAAGPEELRPPAAAAALPGAQHGHLQHLHTLLPSAAASGQYHQHMGACLDQSKAGVSVLHCGAKGHNRPTS